jgi:galactan endo-1,6-beta-galactosidase
VIPLLANRLKLDGSHTFVAGVDSNNISAAVATASRLNPDALAAMGRLDTHDYHHAVGDLAKLQEYKALGAKLRKPIWMSELGCCFHDQNEKDQMSGALFMGDSMRMDLRDLGAEAWILWQPDWEVITFDPRGGEPQLKKQYYAVAQYSRFIRPGFQIISAGGAYHTLAAYWHASKRLVLVTTNWDMPGRNDLDLTAFSGSSRSVQVYRTTADTAVNLREETIALAANGHIVDALPMRSITTYVIDGLTALPSASTNNVEGTHQIVSPATGLCMNITTNSTRAGAAIIPYSCGAYSNEEFNFVDRGAGFYSMQTTNDLASLCLNVSNGSDSPGDGKTRGGPGNLIQWNCSDTSPPANELFRMQAVGADAYQIQVKNSGLCLEDPGGSGTIRQNHCSSKSAQQIFKLL